VLKLLKDKLTSDDIVELLQTRDSSGESVCTNLELNAADNECLSALGSIIKNHNISGEKVLDLLFTQDHSSQTVLDNIVASHKIGYLYDFCSEAALAPETILELMKRLVVSPGEGGHPIKPSKNLKEFELVTLFSYFSMHLLEGTEEASKRTSEYEKKVHRHLSSNPEMNPGWKKMFELMKGVHKKKGGSVSQMKAPVSDSPEVKSGRRLELYVI
jgi:hypothetical protein